MGSALIPYKDIYINTNTGELVDSTITTLGTAAKSVHGAESRAARYALQATARRLLPDERVAQCMHRCGPGGVAINIAPATGLASFAGVVTCGSVWLCPVCSARISHHRRGELNTLLSWARRELYQVRLVTLTARHGSDDKLADLLRAMKGAKKRLHNSRAWHRLDDYVVGHVTATEVTHGVNGWHVHFHMLVILRDGLWLGGGLELDEVWLRALAKEGLQGNGHAYSEQNGDAAGEYVAKWGAAEEIALGDQKVSKGGRTAWQLLAAAATDDQAAMLFRDYASCFKGSRQLVWSVGLKKVVNILEKSDAELADEPEDNEVVEVARVPRALWRVVVRRNLQAELLSVAEEGGSLYVDIWLQALQLQESKRVENGGS